MQGRIEEARPSQSGKTLGVKIGGQWYSTKHWELQNMLGQDITFEASTSEFNGKLMHWLNDYTVQGASNTPSAQAFDQAYQQAPPLGAPVQAQPMPPLPQIPPPRDRDASIIAQALTKACSGPGDSVELVWKRYSEFYDLALGKPKAQKAPPPPPADDFDDSIPF